MLDNFDKKKSPFRIPENYFENFNAEIMNKLPEKETTSVKIVPLWRRIVPWTAVAAVLGGVLFMTDVFKQNSNSDPVIAMSDQNISVIATGIASSSDEEDFYLFLEDEVDRTMYKEMVY